MSPTQAFLVSCLLLVVRTVASHDDVQVETLEEVPAEKCERLAANNDFVTLHFRSSWEGGEVITSTYERGVPVEIQLGTKMLSTGLDDGLRGACIGEKRRITLPAGLGSVDPLTNEESRKIIYEVELLGISDQTTGATFNYLDLDGDKLISPKEAESLVKMFMKALTTEIPGIDAKALVTFFMTLHDRDGDNFISEQEFLHSVSQHERVLNAFGGKDEL